VIVAHVAGVPVEEALLLMPGGAGAGLLLARAWVASRVRFRRRPSG
jgi:hypothetical protein